MVRNEVSLGKPLAYPMSKSGVLSISTFSLLNPIDLKKYFLTLDKLYLDSFTFYSAKDLLFPSEHPPKYLQKTLGNNFISPGPEVLIRIDRNRAERIDNNTYLHSWVDEETVNKYYSIAKENFNTIDYLVQKGFIKMIDFENGFEEAKELIEISNLALKKLVCFGHSQPPFVSKKPARVKMSLVIPTNVALECRLA